MRQSVKMWRCDLRKQVEQADRSRVFRAGLAELIAKRMKEWATAGGELPVRTPVKSRPMTRPWGKLLHPRLAHAGHRPAALHPNKTRHRMNPWGKLLSPRHTVVSKGPDDLILVAGESPTPRLAVSQATTLAT